MNQASRDQFSADTDRDDSPIGIIALWHLLWRNKWRIVLPAFGLAFLAGLIALRGADTYTAESQMLLARGNLEIVEFDSAGGTEVSQSAITNALTILGSRSVALQVVDRLDLLNDPEVNLNLSLPEDTPPEEFYPETVIRQVALDWLAASTQVNILPGGNAISIRATSTHPEKSAAIANAYVDAYLDYQLQRGQAETERAAMALEQRVNELRLRLEEEQQELQAYRASAPNAVLQAQDTLAGEVLSLRTRLADTETTRTEVEAALDVVDDDVTMDDLRATAAESETFTRFERQVLGRAAAETTFAEDVQAIRDALETERTRLLRLEEALRSGLASIESRIAEANAYTVGLRQLEVEAETTSQVYESSLARLKELSIQTGLRDAGAQILARAEAPLRTDASGRRRMVALAGALGLFFGIAWVLVREAANDRVRKVSDLMALTGTDNIVQLPSLRAKGGGGRMAPFIEGVRSLRHSMISTGRQTNESLVAGIFSSLPTDGKTAVIRELAQSFANVGRRVIMVDADMRAGTLSQDLGVSPDGFGLHEVLADNLDPSEAIITLDQSTLDFLPCGRVNERSSDLLESRRFEELIEALKNRYDVVLVDTPPLLVLPDAPKIAALTGASVLVTEYDRTPRPAVRDAVAALKAAKTELMVIALCDAPTALGQDYGLPKRAYAKYWG
jgi:capsular exopolysaccharide synthesis family protein